MAKSDPLNSHTEAHIAVATAIAECFLCQPKEMAWEQRCEELATAAIEGLQLHFDYIRTRQGSLDT